jgi:hypothetical protein
MPVRIPGPRRHSVKLAVAAVRGCLEQKGTVYMTPTTRRLGASWAGCNTKLQIVPTICLSGFSTSQPQTVPVFAQPQASFGFVSGFEIRISDFSQRHWFQLGHQQVHDA